MEEKKAYVRFRGQTTGPYSESEIRAMIERGQISRFHALSSDRSAWKRARQLPALYDDVKDNKAPSSFSEPEQIHIIPGSPAVSPPPKQQAVDAANWYYAQGGREVGPVKEHQIARLVQQGALRPDDLLWSDGMPDWSPVSQTHFGR